MIDMFLFRNDESKTNAKRVTFDNTVVVHGLRNELLETSVQTPELSQAGVYVLISDSVMYVGQSSLSILNRLRSHDSERAWWKEYIAITDTHGDMEKTMTEYMEAYLIQWMKEQGMKLDNETYGNRGNVNPFTMMKTKSYITNSLFIISEVLNVNLVKEQKIANKDESSNGESIKITFEDGNTFEARKVRDLLHSILVHYAKDPILYQNLMVEAVQDPSSKKIVYEGIPSSFFKSELIGGDLRMYSEISTEEATRHLNYFIDILGIQPIVKTREDE